MMLFIVLALFALFIFAPGVIGGVVGGTARAGKVAMKRTVKTTLDAAEHAKESYHAPEQDLTDLKAKVGTFAKRVQTWSEAS